MRVLHVTATGTRRGAEVFASDLVRVLDGAGVEQRVVVLKGTGHPDVAFDAPTSMLGADGFDVPGLRVNSRVLGSMRRAFGDWKPDVIQAHGGEAFKHVALATVGRDDRVLYRRIGGSPRWLARGPRRMVYALLLRRAARVIAVAEVIRRETIGLFRLPPGRVVTIPNGVDVNRVATSVDREQTRSALGLPPDAEVILSLGALTWEKDPLAHLAVSARVLADRPEARHLIVGDGPMRGQVEAGIKEAGLEGRVILAGARREVADILGASDVLLFASRPDGMEGMPAIVIEAGMAGIPIAGFSVAGVAEVVQEGVTGLLTVPGDVEGLAGRVRSLLGDRDGRRTMAEAARRHCRSRFDIRVIAPRYLDLYRETIG